MIRKGEDSWDDAIANAARKVADAQTPADALVNEVAAHYSSPDHPLEEKDKPA